MAQGKQAPLAERFWEHVEKSDGCWNWTATTRGSNGYGQIGEGGQGGRNLSAHRVSWEIHNGPIPDGMFVLHRCDNPLCVNPDHLWLGTIAENNADRERKGRGADRRGEKSTTAKLTTEQVLAIRSDHRPQRIVAEAYGIRQGHVSRLKNGTRWPHLNAQV